MATRRQRVLQDTITAIRHGLPLAECGAHLFRNGERHLRTRRALANIHASVAGGQALLAAAVELARRCTFNLREVKYDYPAELRSEEHTSELQSLMRISYAVFCLKKKKTPHYSSNTPQHKLTTNYTT